ncbi:MAG: phospholipase D-like domain-containing protein [Desulfobulbus sp.]|jgi:cardiolipin synthase|uniref:phospholipase D-like domain-containing protein n=1 Tax=Desulfobulbus sp. TaxID=895 RepID=UPI002843E6D5|nr:phospholipase D-like domain-containing protein [Desulfobulbus sp.]MDR2551078.1 phospholipase D-like domain-containing protein [Desulfobulbus sp.]
MRPPRRTAKKRFRLFGRLSHLKASPDAVRFHHNQVALLPHGGDFFPALFQAMADATTAICAEFYIVKADETGQAFAQALRQAAARGVEVSLIYDAIGCFDTPSSYFQRLQAAGVRCLPFNKPAFSRLHWLDFRDHRKMVVIDGATAFLGGLNIGDEYAGYGDSYEHWRDVGLRLDGPAAGELQRLFRQTWLQEGGGGVPGQSLVSPLPQGEADVIIINGSPHRNRPLIRNTFRLAVAGATRCAQIITPYFLPGPRVVRSLLRAVKRGVQVRMILPSISDVSIVQMLSRAYLKPLMAAGVEVYARQGTILHAKVMLIDDQWVTLGSANLDYRSFHRNFEINIIVDNHTFGLEMKALFDEELALSKRLSLIDHMHATPLERFLEWLLAPLSRFL